MRSMTGIGLGEAQLGDGRIAVTVRSLNHRHAEVRVRLPDELADLSLALEQAIRARVARGRVDVTVRLEGPALAAPSIDPRRARAVFADLTRLRDELAPGSALGIEALAPFAPLLVAAPAGQAAAAEESITRALDAAFTALVEMQDREGAALRTELTARVAEARRLTASIGARRTAATPLQRARLRERVSRLCADCGVSASESRLELELTMLAERGDITEELVRLGSHFLQFEELLGASGGVGRRLDFLLQEIHREINTIGAKSQDAELSRMVVELKAEAERLREQVQNVE